MSTDPVDFKCAVRISFGKLSMGKNGGFQSEAVKI